MSKIVLQNIRLINWYGFTNTTIPIAENLTLISGENECGKSTILDAIKYAYTGDTQFNKASSGYNAGVGKRNLVSYTRCLIDASAGVYARPADKIPAVYTHIAMEYYDQINERTFILGVIIETGISDISGTYWYAIDQKELRDVAFVYGEDSLVKPYNASGFQKRYGVQLKKKQEGITLFMQMVGLKLPFQEVSKYQSKLRNIMTYNPAAKIQEFIKASVLEKHDVNFDKLKDAKKNIEQINNSLEQINQELQDLETILQDYDEHDRKALRLKIDDVKLLYKNIVYYQTKCREAAELIDKNNIQCEELKKLIKEGDKYVDELDKHYSEAKSALRELDVSRAIFASEELIHKWEEQLNVLNKEKEELEVFQKQLEKISILLKECDTDFADFDMVHKITTRETEAVEKKQFLDSLKAAIQICRDIQIKKKALLGQELSEIQSACVEQNKIIENCNKNRADYSYAKEQTELIAEINREFQKRGIREEARMACEYVLDLHNEEWRDAIETFLGPHRYAIIVSPAVFQTANEVMDRSKHRYVELVNTRRLMIREIECVEDSVFQYLDVKNEAAAKYFQYWLGRIHAAAITDVPKYDNAMSKEGKISRNMAVTYINFKKLRSYCLGSEAIELNKERAEKQLRELEKRETEIISKERVLQNNSESLQRGLDCFKEYNLNAHNEAAKVTAALNDERARYEDLIKAQKDNEEFMALSDRVSELGRQLNEAKNVLNENTKLKASLEVEIKAKETEIQTFSAKRKEEQKKIESERISHQSAVDIAIEEYDAYISGVNKDGGLMNPDTKSRNDRRVRELEANIVGAQQAYNNRKQEIDRLPVGLEYESVYQKRRGKIWIDDLQGIQQKLRDQTVQYERIFKREFVLNIYETAKEARSDISDINKELRKLRFSTKYQFDVKMLDDNSDCAKILRYAEYLQETNNLSDGQMSLTDLMGYDGDEVETREREIKDIINRIIDKNDLSQIQYFADYRNYMSYEIIINNDEVTNGKLSKQVGYNSGAGTQIPYTLILSAALSMLYNARVNSARLIFIDEPFEKMSDHNIKLMLDFFKNQNFQVIFCAPPNKLESIGSECGVIIPVLKITNDNMQIGKVKFHEQ